MYNKAQTHWSYKYFLILIATVFLFPPAFAAVKKAPRQTVNFNNEWKYSRGDFSNAGLPDFDDSAWETVGLPHSFSIPYFLSKDFYVGYGWYRKKLRLAKEEVAKKVFLEFDGVFQEAEVFVNGKLAGSHKGGYTGFSVDISSAVKAGDNRIAVRVNNIWRPDLAPRAGEHVFSGGIYRNVRLVLTEPAYIDWYGTFVTTPDLAENKGDSSRVNVKTDVCNSSGKAVRYKLQSDVTDVRGQVVASVVNTEIVPAGGRKQFNQTTDAVPAPALWCPEHPALYKVVSSLYKGNKLVDAYETSFGFRWFEWTVDNGFYLNGNHLYLKGANVHQDHAGWGDAVTEAGMYRDVQLVKAAGFNFIRGSHYPHSPAFARACDEKGMLFWSENAFWGIGGFQKDGYWNCSAYPVDEKDRAGFEASVKQQLAEMIRINRNHPSIVVWSMSNEPFFTAPETIDPMSNLLKDLVALTHRLDSTRPAAIGGAQRPLGKKRIDLLGDIAGYNGDGSSIPEFQHPAVANVVSEYGSTTADRPGNYDPGWGDLAKGGAQNGRSWRSGQAIWCAFDHGSIAGSALGKMGIVDYFRIPKRAWYWYRNEYRQIDPPEWPQTGTAVKMQLDADYVAGILADGTDDVMLQVTMLDANNKPVSSSPAVELKIVSGPGEFPTGASIKFEKDSDIRIADGKAAIEFRSFYSGESVIQATSPGLEPVEIKISFEGGTPYVAGQTPVVKERPYTRFTKEDQAGVLQIFGRNNPTFASSAAAGSAAGLAADGNSNTWWQPAPEDKNPSWILDTERGLLLAAVKIQFPEPKAYQYRVETSEDKVLWSPLFDNMANSKDEIVREIMVPDKVSARFIRISFHPETVPPRISEVEVKGWQH